MMRIYLKTFLEGHYFLDIQYVVAESKLSSLGPIYYEYGSMVVEFDSSSNAIAAFEILKHKIYKDKRLLGIYGAVSFLLSFVFNFFS